MRDSMSGVLGGLLKVLIYSHIRKAHKWAKETWQRHGEQRRRICFYGGLRWDHWIHTSPDAQQGEWWVAGLKVVGTQVLCPRAWSSYSVQWGSPEVTFSCWVAILQPKWESCIYRLVIAPWICFRSCVQFWFSLVCSVILPKRHIGE